MLTEYVEHVSLGTHVYRILRDQGDAGPEHMVHLVSFRLMKNHHLNVAELCQIEPPV